MNTIKRIYKAAASALLPVVLISLGIGFVGLWQGQQEACHQRQRQYDGQISYTRFLAHEGKVPKARTEEAIGHLRDFLGKRPAC